jgi:hypothetical protein
LSGDDFGTFYGRLIGYGTDKFNGPLFDYDVDKKKIIRYYDVHKQINSLYSSKVESKQYITDVLKSIHFDDFAAEQFSDVYELFNINKVDRYFKYWLEFV